MDFNANARDLSQTVPQSPFPTEIWQIVASYLEPGARDIASLARTSKQLLSVCGPFLYSKVSLDCGYTSPHFHTVDDRTVQAFGVLANDRNLAKCVKELELGEHSLWGTSRLLNLSAIANMTSLKSLIIHGVPFRDRREQRRFSDVVEQCCPNLVNFTYVANPTSELPGSFLRIGVGKGLKRITWMGHKSYYNKVLWDILYRSLSTVEMLALPFEVPIPQHFFSLRMKSLRSLTIALSTVQPGGHIHESRNAPLFRRFIAAHPFINHFAFTYGLRDEYLLRAHQLFTPTFLPNLRLLSVSFDMFRVMLVVGISSLKTTLQTLRIGFGQLDDGQRGVSKTAESVDSALRFIRHTKFLLPTVTELILDLSYRLEWHDSMPVVDLFRAFATVCPALKVWRAMFTAKLLADMFGCCLAHFKVLEEVHLGSSNMLPGDDTNIRKYVTRLAVRCDSVRRVVVHPGNHSFGQMEAPLIGEVWTVRRETNGCLKEVELTSGRPLARQAS